MAMQRPTASEGNSTSLVDRPARTALIELIHRYLHGELSAFQFDEELDSSRDSTDPTVQLVVRELWYFYDDITDHFVALSKPAWDYHQRLLLLLASDGQVESTRRRHWGVRQLVAWSALLGYLAVAGWLASIAGWKSLVLAGIPFGVVVLGLRSATPLQRQASMLELVLMPFGSLGELNHALETTGFVKQRIPAEVASRRIRSPGSELLQSMHFFLAAWVAAPLMLVIQAFPESEVHTRVVFDSTRGLTAE